MNEISPLRSHHGEWGTGHDWPSREHRLQSGLSRWSRWVRGLLRPLEKTAAVQRFVVVGHIPNSRATAPSSPPASVVKKRPLPIFALPDLVTHTLLAEFQSHCPGNDEKIKYLSSSCCLLFSQYSGVAFIGSPECRPSNSSSSSLSSTRFF